MALEISSPGRPVAYAVGGHWRRSTGAFIDSGDADEGTWPDASTGPAICWGILRDSPAIIASCQASERQWLYMDHAYAGQRGHSEESSYRCVWNAFQHNTISPRPPDRWNALRTPLQPWRAPGRHILVCAPSEAYLSFHGIPDWIDETLATLAQHTDRPIVVRTKKDSFTIPMPDALKGCHAVVTHASIAAVEAVISGVPAFVDECSAAAPVGSTRLGDIESPVRPDREPWAWSLAYGQWRAAEIRSGEAWAYLKQGLATTNVTNSNH